MLGHDSRQRLTEAQTREPSHQRLDMKKVNLAAKFGLFDEHWSPKLVGELNGQHVKLAKLKGEFIWHRHDEEDELFLVVQGRLVIKLRDGDVVLEPREFFIVPRGVEHKPVADEEVHLLMFEPASTLNTGNVKDERTMEHLDCPGVDAATTRSPTPCSPACPLF